MCATPHHHPLKCTVHSARALFERRLHCRERLSSSASCMHVKKATSLLGPYAHPHCYYPHMSLCWFRLCSEL